MKQRGRLFFFFFFNVKKNYSNFFSGGVKLKALGKNRHGGCKRVCNAGEPSTADVETAVPGGAGCSARAPGAALGWSIS